MYLFIESDTKAKQFPEFSNSRLTIFSKLVISHNLDELAF